MLRFHFAQWVFNTLRLAVVLDSLVRVSRRVGSRHFVKVLENHSNGSPHHPTLQNKIQHQSSHSNTASAEYTTRLTGRLNRHHATLTQSASPVTVSGAFHPLFKVLSIFPSRYLFAIGLPPVFRLWWSLPPVRAAFSSYPTRLFASSTRKSCVSWTGLSPSTVRNSMRLTHTDPSRYKQTTTPQWGFSSRSHPASLAATEGILVSFFSSA